MNRFVITLLSVAVIGSQPTPAVDLDALKPYLAMLDARDKVMDAACSQDLDGTFKAVAVIEAGYKIMLNEKQQSLRSSLLSLTPYLKSKQKVKSQQATLATSYTGRDAIEADIFYLTMIGDVCRYISDTSLFVDDSDQVNAMRKTEDMYEKANDMLIRSDLATTNVIRLQLVANRSDFTFKYKDVFGADNYRGGENIAESVAQYIETAITDAMRDIRTLGENGKAILETIQPMLDLLKANKMYYN